MIFDSFPSNEFLTAFKRITGPQLLEKTKSMKGEPQFYDALIKSYFASNDRLKANKHWQDSESSLINLNSLSSEQSLHPAFVKMLAPWIGITGLSSGTIELWEPYKDLITSLVPQEDFLICELENLILKKELLATDLGTVFDFFMIFPFLRTHHRPLNILEVGGGYGRLALMLNAFPKAVSKYVMIDAVPSSLYFSFLLLKSFFPEKKVGSPILGDHFEDCDFWICPSWDLTSIPDDTFDLCVNIESMQEMDQHHVDFYLSGFDKWAKADALIYLSNSKDYVFKGTWNIPTHWQLAITERSPRAWTKNHPTECYLKKKNSSELLTSNDLEIIRSFNIQLAEHKKSLTLKLEDLTKHNAELNANRIKNENEIEEKHKREIAKYHEEISHLTTLRDQILNSTSFRLTKPLRYLWAKMK